MEGSGLESGTATVTGGPTAAIPPDGDLPDDGAGDPEAAYPPVGKFGIRAPQELESGLALEVFVTTLPRPERDERYLISVVPVARGDDYWGFWQILDPMKHEYTLRPPGSSGSWEIRVGRAKYPSTTYEVLDRVKVRVR
jgi:hypothetical protein